MKKHKGKPAGMSYADVLARKRAAQQIALDAEALREKPHPPPAAVPLPQRGRLLKCRTPQKASPLGKLAGCEAD